MTALIIEDDRGVADFFTRVLQTASFGVTVANSGAEGVAAVQELDFSAIVLDMCLPDVHGLDVLQVLRAKQPDAHIVVVSGHLTVATTIEALRRGANNVLQKPAMSDQLLAGVSTAIVVNEQHRSGRMARNHWRATEALGRDSHSVAHRWANYVVKGSSADSDSRTLEGWARSAGASVTMICESCRMLEIKPHDARDLTRALGAMFRSAQYRCPPAALLDVVDSRTLRMFQRRAGSGFQPARDLASINRFLTSQSFVDPLNRGIAVLRQALATWRA